MNVNFRNHLEPSLRSQCYFPVDPAAGTIVKWNKIHNISQLQLVAARCH